MKTLKLDRGQLDKLIASLIAISSGLGDQGEQQANCFVFGDGKILTYNEEITCSCENPVDGIAGAVPAAPLLKVLRQMADEKFLSITMDESGLLIETEGGASSRIFIEKEVVLSVEEFEAPAKWAPLPEKFIDAVNVASSCVSRENGRVILKCVHIHPNWIEGCDNDQVCRYTIDTGLDEPVLVYATSMKKVLESEPSRFCKTDNWLHFKTKAGVVLSCRRVLGDYHNLTKLLESRGVKTVLPKGLLQVVERCAIFSSEERENYVQIRLKGNSIWLKGQGPSGWYQERIKTQTPYEGEPVKFMIPPVLLRSIMSRSRNCEVCPGKLIVVNDDFVYLTCTLLAE